MPQLERRKTRSVAVGDVAIGGDNPVVIQSMITEETGNISGAVNDIIRLHRLGFPLIRVTTPTLKDAQNLSEITDTLRRVYRDVPLVADVHHQGGNIAQEAAKYVRKVRINPGLFQEPKFTGQQDRYSVYKVEGIQDTITQSIRPLLERLKLEGGALRIGVNHGSLSERMKVIFGNNPLGMVQSALEYLEICENEGFKNIVISLKASNVKDMVDANRLMVERMNQLSMDYPLHIGLTEAGLGESARAKSIIAIGTLLLDGIGDTIRVSLSESREQELNVCDEILQAVGIKYTKAELVACPSCGRSKFDVPTMARLTEIHFSHLVGLKIATMGCVVNGPGEVTDADYGIIGKGGGKVAVCRGNEEIKIVSQGSAIEELKSLIKKDGRWIDSPKIDNFNPVLNPRVQF